ncbi:wings apart-like protein 1 isoform X2 [Impatiens glandulifera]|uniref:wings apart-like protein 1 isoform X2 n=1 Tax=Impatiens glandulifera TaxID=253017 RepID=UPI001FB17AA2|nr:wings apart-like protein 1 isoform X2 [Impatiens glandulifera]
MIVRTYGRRNRGIERDGYSDSGCHDLSDGFEHPISQEVCQSQDRNIFSSQDSSHWSVDPELPGANLSQAGCELTGPPQAGNWVNGDLENGNVVSRKLKKRKTLKEEEKKLGCKKLKSKGSRSAVCGQADVVGTTTLMETQEFGEMMEHLDEVNFALDGLRKGQPVRIRRASLLSLISICGSAQQRRLLRSHGLAKTIIDAVLALNLDDSPSNLAAAALFYVLTSDGQDDQILDSATSIQFLMKLLKPISSASGNKKTPNIGFKLLAFRKNVDVLQDSGKEVDSTTSAIFLKVQELLVNCKEMKSGSGSSDATGKPELSPKWMALLTIEKACLTTISLEDTTGAVRKTGSKFKEKLRELGGLDEVFDVTRKCQSVLERWLKKFPNQNKHYKGSLDLESLALLLKCLRINENATFLSENNQNHLLGLKGNFDHEGFPESFVHFIISIIKVLSGLSLLRSSLEDTDDKKFHDLSIGIEKDSLSHFKGNCKEINEIITISSSINSSATEDSSQKRPSTSQEDHKWLTSGKSGDSKTTSSMTRAFVADSRLLKIRANSSTFSSCSGTTSSSVGRSFCNIGKQQGIAVENSESESHENSQDPFAFHDEEFEPSKWELLSEVKRPPPRTLHNKALSSENGIECRSETVLSLGESSNKENDVLSSSALDEDTHNLLADCFLTAIKVLMNLTNDNPKGCDQIASCGGIETLSSLIVDHFPSFTTSARDQKETNLSDQELDLLVAILGLLVNLVEKDNHNRLRLVETSVPLTRNGDEKMNVIPLLCSIFLAYQRVGDAGEEGKLEWDDEEAVLQGAKEAEKMIVEAYAALLLAFLSTESKATRKNIAQFLPRRNLTTLVPVLERFVEFHLSLNMISTDTHKIVLEVIESCRIA